MTLTTEEFGDLPDVDAATLDRALQADAFGQFAILAASDEEYIQAGCDWQPGEECRKFLRAHDSDPWLLEYRDAGQQYRAVGHVTLDQVRQAFRSYLLGGSEWRSAFVWVEWDV